MIELLNCPFCGNKAQIRKGRDSVLGSTTTTAECISCLAEMQFDGSRYTDEQVAEKWNTRTTTTGNSAFPEGEE